MAWNSQRSCEVAVDVLPLGEPVELARAVSCIRSISSSPIARGADPRREPLEAEARGIDLLEVLARQAAHERAAVSPTSTRPSRSSCRQADADRRLRDAEPLREVALHERRPLGQLPADDQVAERAGDPLLDRLAADRLDLFERLQCDAA